MASAAGLSKYFSIDLILFPQSNDHDLGGPDPGWREKHNVFIVGALEFFKASGLVHQLRHEGGWMDIRIFTNRDYEHFNLFFFNLR